MNETKDAFQQLYSVIQKLRSPEGCPWDREQTAGSLKEYVLEEAFELVEAIEKGFHEDVVRSHHLSQGRQLGYPPLLRQGCNQARQSF